MFGQLRATHARPTRLHMLLIQNLLNGQEFDDASGSVEECGGFVVGVFGVAEADEEPALASAFDAGVEQGRGPAGRNLGYRFGFRWAKSFPHAYTLFCSLGGRNLGGRMCLFRRLLNFSISLFAFFVVSNLNFRADDPSTQ